MFFCVYGLKLLLKLVVGIEKEGGLLGNFLSEWRGMTCEGEMTLAQSRVRAVGVEKELGVELWLLC